MMEENVTLKSIKTQPSHSSAHLTKEISTLDYEVYYTDGSAAVPFTWESRPGTPKVRSRDSPLLPPLTPPPSFHNFISSKTSNKYPSVPKINAKKSPRRLSPSTSASSTASSPWSNSHSVPSSPFQGKHLSSPRMSLDSRFREDEYDRYDPQRSTSPVCFGTGRSRRGRSRGGCTFSILKLLLRDFA